jgi:hypothetical protein
MEFLAEIDRLRQQIEKCDADDRAGTEAQYQVQLVAQLERQQAAEKCAEERCGGDDC